MDGITLSVIRCEIEGYLPLKVQKVQQPGKKELVFSLWGPKARERLVLSLEGAEPFFGFSDERKENPQNPPGFCLALRKRLEGGSLQAMRQHGLDRVLYLDFDGHDDFGGVVRYVLVFDMAGREQNIGLYKDGLLEASIVPSDEGRFEHRSPYTPPPGDRLDIRSLSASREGGAKSAPDLAAMLLAGDGSSFQVLSKTVEGAGKDLIKGILARAGQSEASAFSRDGAATAASVLVEIGEALREACESGSGPDREPRAFRPAIYISPKGPILHVVPLPHLDVDSEFDTALAAARAFRDRSMRSREFESLLAYAEALHRKVFKKVESRHEAQTGDLTRSHDYDKYRVWAQLIDSSGKRNAPGAKEMTVTDYYADPPVEVMVPLDPKRSSRDNARAYYQAYAKLARAEKVLQDSVASLAADLSVLAEARETLDRALDVADVSGALSRIEALARREGIAVKSRGGSARQEGPAKGTGGTHVRTVVGPDGATFIVGGSAKQNDELVTRLRMPGDIWLHAKGVRGAHVLARPAQGQGLSDEALLAAAKIAAQKSGAKDSPKVEVDYVDAMKVRKPRGGAPGFVTYTGQKSLIVALE